MVWHALRHILLKGRRVAADALTGTCSGAPAGASGRCRARRRGAAALAAAAQAEEPSWRDVESRIQYAYYTEDAAALRKLGARSPATRHARQAARLLRGAARLAAGAARRTTARPPAPGTLRGAAGAALRQRGRCGAGAARRTLPTRWRCARRAWSAAGSGGTRLRRLPRAQGSRAGAAARRRAIRACCSRCDERLRARRPIVAATRSARSASCGGRWPPSRPSAAARSSCPAGARRRPGCCWGATCSITAIRSGRAMRSSTPC